MNNNNIDKEQPGPSNVVLDRRMLSLSTKSSKLNICILCMR